MSLFVLLNMPSAHDAHCFARDRFRYMLDRPSPLRVGSSHSLRLDYHVSLSPLPLSVCVSLTLSPEGVHSIAISYAIHACFAPESQTPSAGIPMSWNSLRVPSSSSTHRKSGSSFPLRSTQYPLSSAEVPLSCG